MRLSDGMVASLELPAGKSDYIVFDDKVIGLGVRLRDRCRPTWVYQYRFGLRQRRMQLGPIAKLDTISARQQAKRLQTRIVLGEDPQVAMARRASRHRRIGRLVDIFLLTLEVADLCEDLGEVERIAIKHIRARAKAPAP
jgi:hypothetical protein